MRKSNIVRTRKFICKDGTSGSTSRSRRGTKPDAINYNVVEAPSKEDRKKLTLRPPSQSAIESISVGSGPSKRPIVQPVTERFGSMEDLMSRIPTLFHVTLTGLTSLQTQRSVSSNILSIGSEETALSMPFSALSRR